MECPVCYNEYDTDNFKPKLADCGHTICQHCIKKLKKCCLCNTPFAPDRLLTRHSDYFSHPLLANFASLESGNKFKDNYALIDVLEKHNKEYDVCRSSRLPEDFFCMDCRVTVCNKCIDQDHSEHAFRRISSEMYKITKTLSMKIEETQSKLLENLELQDTIDRAQTKNNTIKEEGRKIIDAMFDRMVVMIYNSRDHVKKFMEDDLTNKSELIERVSSSIEGMADSLTKLKDQMNDLRSEIKNDHYLKNSSFIERFEELDKDLIPLHKEVTLKIDEYSSENFEVNSMKDRLEIVISELKKVLPGYDKNHPTNPFDDTPVVQKPVVISRQNSTDFDRINNHHSRHVFRRRDFEEDDLPPVRGRQESLLDAIENMMQGSTRQQFRRYRREAMVASRDES